MRKHWKWAAAALALVCMVSMLAGCGNDPGAATKDVSDHIVSQINEVIEGPSETKGLSYKYVSGYIEDGFIFNKYSSTDTTNEIEDIVTLEIIFTEDSKDFIGSRVSSSAGEGGHIYTYTKVTFPNVEEFKMDDLTDNMVEVIEKYYIEGAELNDFKVSYLESQDNRRFMLVKAKYYDQLKFEN